MAHLTEEQLNLYLDNELSTPEHTVVEAHLADCSACRSELASLEILFFALNRRGRALFIELLERPLLKISNNV